MTGPAIPGPPDPVSSLEQAARRYAALGIPVVPLTWPIRDPRRGDVHCSCLRAGCDRPGKHPIGLLVPHGVRDATLDERVITTWWRKYPQANVGLATGHRFDVLDIDGPAGIEALRDFVLGTDAGVVLGEAPVVRTGNGGLHYYLASTGLGNHPPRGLAHVDWRGRGGLVVAPPSCHSNGQRYTFLRGLDRQPPPVPEPLRALLRPQRTASARAASRNERFGFRGHPYALAAIDRECAALAALPANSGRRNHTLYLAGLRLHSLAAGGALDHDGVDAALLAASKACGLGEQEARSTLRSARRTGQRNPRGIPTQLRQVRSPQPTSERADGRGSRSRDSEQDRR